MQNHLLLSNITKPIVLSIGLTTSDSSVFYFSIIRFDSRVLELRNGLDPSSISSIMVFSLDVLLI